MRGDIKREVACQFWFASPGLSASDSSKLADLKLADLKLADLKLADLMWFGAGGYQKGKGLVSSEELSSPPSLGFYPMKSSHLAVATGRIRGALAEG